MHGLTKHFLLLTILPALAGQAQINLQPIAKFTFNNGDFTNRSGKSTSKAYSVSLVKDRFGNPRSACYLQGDYGSYINLGSGNEVKPPVGSISLWINMAYPMYHGKGVEQNPFIMTRAHGGLDHNEAFFMGYQLSTKNICCCTSLSSEKQLSLCSVEPPELRTWHHLVMTYDDNFMCFYVDGKKEGQVPKNFRTIFLEGDSVIVGNRFSENNQRFYVGIIDDIEIYNKVLSQDEVLQLYHAANPNRARVLLNRVLYIALVLVIVAALIYAVRLRIKHVLKKEKEKNDLVNKAMEFEIRMMKAQMDPHFIFNSLNTILQFIITRENDKAETYLTKFSKLVRQLLKSNTKEAISLKDELDILSKYLEMESLRFDTFFDIVIEFSENIVPEAVYIPHMLIQPLIENSIWHGLRTKKGEKKINIRFNLINSKALLCVIEDNGIGRKAKSKKQADDSMALGFIGQRLELMSKIYNFNYQMSIIDKVDTQGESLGTKVELTIPIVPC